MRRRNFIPSRTSPKGGRRGCLCPDGRTYSIKCCTGELQAQGIGSIYPPNETAYIAFIAGSVQTYNGIPLIEGELYVFAPNATFEVIDGELIVTGADELLYSINDEGFLIYG